MHIHGCYGSISSSFPSYSGRVEGGVDERACDEQKKDN